MKIESCQDLERAIIITLKNNNIHPQEAVAGLVTALINVCCQTMRGPDDIIEMLERCKSIVPDSWERYLLLLRESQED